MAERSKKEIADNFNSSQGFFGQPLDHEAPIVVCDCFAFIRNKGLYDVGVFRVSGSQDVVNALRKKYDAEYPDAESKETKQTSILNTHEPPPSVNDIASLLKSYFKDLKEPLIPTKITEQMVEVLKGSEDDKMKIRSLSKIVKAIPSPNRECLGFLISFLREICTFKKFNQMSAENLATCFVLSVMGGNDAFDQLYLLGNGAVVIKMLITKDIHLYMPRVQNVKKNTKYKDIAAVNDADDNGHSAGEKTPPAQSRQANSSNSNEGPFTPKGSSGKKAKVNRENPGMPIGGQYDDILKSGVEHSSGSPAEPPARPKKNMNMAKKYEAPADTIKYMPGVPPLNNNFNSSMSNAPSSDAMIDSLPPPTGSPKAPANQADKQRGKKVKDSNAKYDKSGNKQKNPVPSDAFPPFAQPISGSRNQRSKPVKADDAFPELAAPGASRPKAINDGDLPFPEGPDF